MRGARASGARAASRGHAAAGRRAGWAAALAILCALACAESCGERQGERDGPEDPARSGAGPSSASPSSGAGPSSASPRFVTRYALARHLARAELRRGGDLVVDLGVPGGAKHTLGGWQTQVGEDVVLGETSALLVPGVTGRVVLPVEGEGAAALHLRARAFGDGRLTVYVDDRAVHHAVLPTDGTFATVTVPLPADALPAGERFLGLRVPRTGAAEGVARAGLALDWMALARSPDDAGLFAPPSPAELAPEGDEPTLVVPAGFSLGFAVELPAGARLRGARRGAGRLEVVVRRDGRAPERLATLGGDGTPSAEGTRPAGTRPEGTRRDDAPVAFDLELGAFAGEVVRLDLAAAGASVTLVRPAIVEPAPAQAALGPPPPARNVLVYLIDTLRADKLTPYAPGTRVRTPGLGRWAPTATVFERCQSQENWTKPSVATLLSGLLPWQHQATSEDAVVPASVELLSERLRERGFHTGSFIANGYVSDKFGFRQGWSTYRNYIREGRRTQARFVAADVLAWLDARPTDRPFFLYVHTIDPHVPYLPPDAQLSLYDPDPYEGPVDFARDRLTLEKIKSGALRLGARDRVRLEALYDGEITYHDLHLASILEGLSRRGLADDTIVVITSDHGEELFDHGSVGHGHTVYQELLHVPLLVRVPGLTEGDARIEEAVGLVDVAPTVLDALGQPVPPGLAGRSLLPLLRGEREDAPRAAVSGFMRGWRTVLVGRMKLVQRTAAHASVYDLGADPSERTDLAASRPILLRYLRGLLGLALAGHLGGARPATHAAERTDIDPVTEAQLRELGYVPTPHSP